MFIFFAVKTWLLLTLITLTLPCSKEIARGNPDEIMVAERKCSQYQRFWSSWGPEAKRQRRENTVNDRRILHLRPCSACCPANSYGDSYCPALCLLSRFCLPGLRALVTRSGTCRVCLQGLPRRCPPTCPPAHWSSGRSGRDLQLPRHADLPSPLTPSQGSQP